MQTCNKCKHVIGNREHTEKWEQWKCGHPNNIEREAINPINGVNTKIYRIEYCVNQRLNKVIADGGQSICGIEGIWFEEYEEHKFDPTIGGQTPVELEVFDAATLEANRKKADERVAAIKAKKLSKDDLSNL